MQVCCIRIQVIISDRRPAPTKKAMRYNTSRRRLSELLGILNCIQYSLQSFFFFAN